MLSLFLLQITLPHPQINSNQAADHWSSRLIVLRTPSFNDTTTSPINSTPSFYVSIWHSHCPLATPISQSPISPSPISGLWVCADGCGCGCGCGLVDVDLGYGFVSISLVVLFFFFWGGVGGCGFVSVMAVGVVAAVVVGGRCCSRSGCAVVVVDDDNEDDKE